MEIPVDQLSERQKEVSKILRAIKLETAEITWLSSNVILRSFTGSTKSSTQYHSARV